MSFMSMYMLRKSRIALEWTYWVELQDGVSGEGYVSP